MLATHFEPRCPQAGESDTYHHRVVIDSQADQCRRVLDEILAMAKAFDFCERELLAVHLAAEEALVNAIKHGNRFDPDFKVTINYTVTANEIRVRVTDQGDGFDPRTVPDPTVPDRIDSPSGRGLMLMQEFMTGLRFNNKGNSVKMWKLRDQVEATPNR